MLPEMLKIKSRSGIQNPFQFSERFELQCEFENEDVLFQTLTFSYVQIAALVFSQNVTALACSNVSEWSGGCCKNGSVNTKLLMSLWHENASLSKVQ